MAGTRNAWEALSVCVCLMLVFPAACWGIDEHRDLVLHSIQTSRSALADKQLENGLFPADGYLTHSAGSTAISTLALLKTARQFPDTHVKRAAEALRKVRWTEIQQTHEIALGLMAFTALNQPEDRKLCEQLSRVLTDSQQESGGWNHVSGDSYGDLSISFFALLALRDADRSGISVPGQVWENAARYWTSLQNSDGGWYDFASIERRASNDETTSPSGTVTATLAGISALTLCERMAVRSERIRSISKGEPPVSIERSQNILKGIEWLRGQDRSKTRILTPAAIAAFHLYGLELAGRSGGWMFSGEREWYRIGVASLLATRSERTQLWAGTNESVATSYALIYLSSGHSPALVHQACFSAQGLSPSSSAAWDVNEVIVRQTGWPRMIGSRELQLEQLIDGAEDAPLLYLTHVSAPEFTDSEVNGLRAYLERGGLLFVSPGSHRPEFETGLLELIQRLYPAGEAELQLLPARHPVYHCGAELTPETTPIYGVETGCRTAIIYSPANLSASWELKVHSSTSPVQDEISPAIEQNVKITLNVFEYATGMKAPRFPVSSDRLSPVLVESPPHGEDRSQMQIGQIQHRSQRGAPQAMRRLISRYRALQLPSVRAEPALVALDSPGLFNHPLLTFHGSRPFELTEDEISNLRHHLEWGGTLFADACCGAEEFDLSFREMVEKMFPGRHLDPISQRHEFFSTSPGFSLENVKLLTYSAERKGAGGIREPHFGLPDLEGLEIDGRLVIIYSRYDLSCALETSAALHCTGYTHEDAVKIGCNVILYSLLQGGSPGS